MKLVLISIGRIKKDYIKTGTREYLTRIQRYSPIEVVEVKEETGANIPIAKVLEKEAQGILKSIKQGDFVIALADKGKHYSSNKFAEFINELSAAGKRRICFIIGGAYGLHQKVLEGADLVVALSPMTFPHELARLVLLEQIYRAFTILRNEPYSH
ncbi:MAG: 23S rRNA (pseudouridine(1915)-N(3))-methyltransferase RlmH [Deltaproteobacteria bacterium]|nr:23S rRNA (pseudouridine(1915)-N(3))-methyltransferase RlmH [Deltaproteobacteria bacterium]